MRGERLAAAGAVAEEPANRRKWFAGSEWDSRGRDLILFFVVVVVMVAAAAISAATATAVAVVAATSAVAAALAALAENFV